MTLPAFLSDPAVGAIFDALPHARIVGGAVRDALIGRAVADIDLATPDTPDAVAAALARSGIRCVPTGLDHGTQTAVVNGRGYEITTLRRDVETDGRHAVVAFTDDWREDAARRDFTINAMSMTRDGAVFDYFGGQADLRAGIVRFVGDAATRIAEDYLRILRFFRFFARYGGTPDPAAIDAIREAVPGLAGLSVERVWSEVSRILAAPEPVATIVLMAQLGVLAAVLPEGTSVPNLARLVQAAAPADPILRLAALLTGGASDLALRLKLSAAERDRLLAIRQPNVLTPEADDDALRRALADVEPAVLLDRLWLAGGGAPGWAALRDRLAAMPRPVFPLEGRDVLALGVPPGPEVGVRLRAVRAWWWHRGCQDSAEACRAELRRR